MGVLNVPFSIQNIKLLTILKQIYIAYTSLIDEVGKDSGKYEMLGIHITTNVGTRLKLFQ